MSVLICKPYHFIFNRWAVAWPGSFNHAGIQWGTIQIGPNDLMRLLISISQPTGYLINLYIFRISRKRKRHYSLIAKLLFHLGEINTSFVNTCRCSRFKPIHFNSMGFQRICQMIGRLKSVWTGVITDISVNTSGFQISTCTQYTRPAVIYCTGKCFHTGQNTVFHNDLCYFSLLNGQIWRIFQSFSHPAAIVTFICLCSQRMHCRPFRAIQHLRLNKCMVNIFSHFSTQCINLSDQMAFGASAYIGITWHQCNTVYADSKHHRFQTQSCTGKRSFTACMSCPYYHHICSYF